MKGKVKSGFLFFIALLTIFTMWLPSGKVHASSYVSDSLRLSRLDKMMDRQKLLSPTFSHGEKEEGNGKLDLLYQYQQGDLRKAQEAFTVKKVDFYAEGYRQLGKFRVAATFNFNKIFEDSLANGQRNNLDDFSTFYAYANKSGDYERQNYEAHTSLKYSLNTIWDFDLGVDYLKHWSAGKDDPRLRNDVFVFKIAPGIQRHIKNHTLHVQGILGKGEETSSLMFKNREYRTSLLYPDRIHYMNYGYGSSVIKDSSNVYRTQQFMGGRIDYQWKSDHAFLRAHLEYQKQYEESINTSRTSSQNKGPVGTLTIHNYRAFWNWYKEIDHKKHFVQTELQIRSGFDGNVKTSGRLDIVNYEFGLMEAEFLYLFQPRSWSLGGSIKFLEEERIDHHQSVRLFAQNLRLTIPLEKQWNRRESLWRLAVSPYFQTNIGHDFQFNPISMSEFIRHVAFTDSYYLQLNRFGSHLQGEWIPWTMNQQKIGFFLDVLWSNGIKPAEDPRLLGARIPNGDRWSSKIGLRMYVGGPKTL